jgi:type IX secretion system PorP/SprF family membrane protein
MKSYTSEILKWFKVAILILGFNQLRAQQVPIVNQYFQNQSFTYPSTTAFKESSQFSMLFRRQFSGLEGAPTSLILNYANRLGENMGWGANVSNLEFGLLKQTRFMAAYAYKIRFDAEHELSIGAQAGMSVFGLNDEMISVESLNDQVLLRLIGSKGSAFQMDWSISYRKNRFGVNLAVPGLINQSTSNDEYATLGDDNLPDFVGQVHYEFILDAVKRIHFTPVLSVRDRSALGSQIDLVGKVDYQGKFSVFGGFRQDYGGTAGVGVLLKPGIELTYSYDFGNSEVPFLSNGFSEFGLHFSFKKKEIRVLEQIGDWERIEKRIEEENLTSPTFLSEEERKTLSDYYYYTETGNKKIRRIKADMRYNSIFDKQKTELALRIQSEIERQKEEIDSLQRINAEIGEQMILAAKKQEDARRMEQEKLEFEKYRISLPIDIDTTNNSVENLPIESVNNLSHDFIIVVAAFKIAKNRIAFIEQVKADFPEARIYPNKSRGLDYIYVYASDNRQEAEMTLRRIRLNPLYKDAWLYITEPEEKDGR